MNKRIGISRKKRNLADLEQAVPLEEQDQPEYEGTTGHLTIYDMAPEDRPVPFGRKKRKKEGK